MAPTAPRIPPRRAQNQLDYLRLTLPPEINPDHYEVNRRLGEYVHLAWAAFNSNNMLCSLLVTREQVIAQRDEGKPTMLAIVPFPEGFFDELVEMSGETVVDWPREPLGPGAKQEQAYLDAFWDRAWDHRYWTEPYAHKNQTRTLRFYIHPKDYYAIRDYGQMAVVEDRPDLLKQGRMGTLVDGARTIEVYTNKSILPEHYEIGRAHV